jgi:hypothetical protein
VVGRGDIGYPHLEINMEMRKRKGGKYKEETRKAKGIKVSEQKILTHRQTGG